MTFLEAALELASRRWPVFPVKPRGKIPLTGRGFKDASIDPDVIREWWVRKWPSANIGVATGAIIVIDVDGADGEKSLAAQIAQHGPLPQTLESATGRGRQLFFAANGSKIRNDAGQKLGPGIDIRGDGGYVVVPPSIHENGKTYTWVCTAPPAELPAWLATKLNSATPNGAARDGAAEATIPQGQRNAALTSLAGTMRRRGMTSAEILAALLVVNAQRCYPPLQESEVRIIAGSVAKYAPTASLLTQSSSDAGNAERLLTIYGDRLLYCPPWRKWLVWDGTRWALDERDQIRALARATMWQLGEQAFKAANKDLVKYGLKSLDTAKLSNAIREAQDQRAVLPRELDSDPDLLNFKNGTLNLRTGKMAVHNPKQQITKLIHCAYDENTSCPQFSKFIASVVQDGQAPLLLRALGYSVTGHTVEKVNFVCWGPTNSGKTTLLELVREFLEEYSTLVMADSLMVHKHQDANAMSDLADLCGARFAMTSETREKQQLDEATLKRNTPGRGTIKASRKYQLPFEFPATHKLWVDTNHQLVITGVGDDVWGRILPFAFGPRIPDEKIDKTLPDRLRKEMQGVLALLCKEAKAWYTEGLGKLPDKVVNTRAEWREQMDRVRRFIKERCHLEEGRSCRPRELYRAYYEWDQAGGEKPMTETMFGRRVKDVSEQLKITKSRDTTGRDRYEGVTPKAWSEQ